MKICKGWLQALLSPAPRGFAARSRVLATLTSLAPIGELARRLDTSGLVIGLTLLGGKSFLEIILLPQK